MTDHKPPTWRDCVREAFQRFPAGEPVHIRELYWEAAEVRRKYTDEPLSATYDATIRRTVQQLDDVEPVPEKGKGYWRLIVNDEQDEA